MVFLCFWVDKRCNRVHTQTHTLIALKSCDAPNSSSEVPPSFPLGVHVTVLDSFNHIYMSICVSIKILWILSQLIQTYI